MHADRQSFILQSTNNLQVVFLNTHANS